MKVPCVIQDFIPLGAAAQKPGGVIAITGQMIFYSSASIGPEICYLTCNLPSHLKSVHSSLKFALSDLELDLPGHKSALSGFTLALSGFKSALAGFKSVISGFKVAFSNTSSVSSGLKTSLLDIKSAFSGLISTLSASQITMRIKTRPTPISRVRDLLI